MRLFFASIASLVVVALAGAACSGGADASADWGTVQNRLWIEKKPKDAREMVRQLVLLDDDGQRVGAGMKCSAFRYLIDLVAWQGKGDELRMFFPQTRQERRAKVRAWSCKGEAPDGFELCLDLKDAEGRTRRLYSMRDWEIESLDDARALGALLAGGPGAAAEQRAEAHVDGATAFD